MKKKTQKNIVVLYCKKRQI